MEQSGLSKIFEEELKQKEAELKQKEADLNLKQAGLSLEQLMNSIEQQKFDREINRQELLRRAIEVSNAALARHSGNTGADWEKQGAVKELTTLLTTATEKLTQSIDAL